MIHEVKVPELGESISEGVIVEWQHEDGASVDAGDPLLELETDKITMEIEAPAAGRLEILAEVEATVTVAQVIAKIHDDGGDSAPKDDEKAEDDDDEEESTDEKEEEKAEDEEADEGQAPPIAPPSGKEQARAKIDAGELSPAVRRLVTEHELDPEAIDGTGKGGRLTKEDVLRHLESSKKEVLAEKQDEKAEKQDEKAEKQDEKAEKQDEKAEKREAPDAGGEPRQTRKRMSRLRHRIAERLVDAQHTAAILTTFNEADMSAVIELRKRHKETFKEKHGVAGWASCPSFVKAVGRRAQDRAPAQHPDRRRRDRPEPLLRHRRGGRHRRKGLVVPVMRDCDRIGFADIERPSATWRGPRETGSSPSRSCPEAASPSPTAASMARCCRRRSSTRPRAASWAARRSSAPGGGR